MLSAFLSLISGIKLDQTLFLSWLVLPWLASSLTPYMFAFYVALSFFSRPVIFFQAFRVFSRTLVETQTETRWWRILYTLVFLRVLFVFILNHAPWIVPWGWSFSAAIKVWILHKAWFPRKPQSLKETSILCKVCFVEISKKSHSKRIKNANIIILWKSGIIIFVPSLQCWTMKLSFTER